MADPTEGLSLHERLREAAHDTSQTDWDGCPVVSYDLIAMPHLAAIQEAIEAPWRERYDALKARADSLREAAVIIERAYSVKTTRAMREAIAAYDAADLAGETQDGGACPKCNGRGLVPRVNYQPGYEDKDMDCPQCGGTGESAPIPSDINWHGEFGIVTDRDGKTSSWVKSDTPPHLNYDTRESAPSPTDAAAEGEAVGEMLDSMTQEQFDIGIHDGQLGELFRWKTDLERWREGVDDSLTKMKRQAFNFETRLQDRKEPSARLLELERWREETQKVIDTLQVWGVDLQKRLDALRGPEVTVTGQMVDAFWDAYNAAGPSQMPTWRGLEAALRAGGAK